MRNRFKGLDLIDRVSDELWNEVRDIVQGTGIKKKKKKKTRLVAFKSFASEKCHINSRESTARASAYILQGH